MTRAEKAHRKRPDRPQYTTPRGKVSGYQEPERPVCGIEGITSPDGRVFGKMGHSERKGETSTLTCRAKRDQQIFESGVRYFGNKGETL